MMATTYDTKHWFIDNWREKHKFEFTPSLEADKAYGDEFGDTYKILIRALDKVYARARPDQSMEYSVWWLL
jgi:hypothetical protein